MSPPDPHQIARLYQEALRHQARGDLDGAEAHLRQVLAARPRQAEALFQMGRIAMARGAAKRAVQHFDKAAEVKPGEPAIWLAYAQAVAALGDKARTRSFHKGLRAAKLPSEVVARVQEALSGGTAPSLGDAPPDQVKAVIALVNAGKFAEAEARAAQLRARHPRVALLADIHGNALARLGRRAAAQEAFEEALALDPGFVEARLSLGRLFAEGGDLETAIAEFRKAAEARPTAPGPQRLLAETLLRAKDFAAAAEAFARVIALGDRRAETYDAEAQALDGAGRPEDALAAHDNAVAAAPDRPETHGRRGIHLQRMGRFEEADAAFRRAIALAPDNGEPFRLMVKGHRIKPDDPLIPEMEALWAQPGLSDHSRMNLGFALAKAMEDAGAHDRIFAYLHRANALMRKLYPYDIAERRTEVDAIRAAFADTDFATRRIAGTTDYAPVFVTGMPRSGTTLVEQIVASHSRVSGGGELGYLVPEALRMMGDGAGGLRALGEVAEAEIAALGRKVEAHFRMRLPGSDLVTDKSIQTYMVAGLVRLALPKARIVVVHRDPRDIGLSIYKNVFAEGTHRYAYDLRDLGLYYRMFLEMVAFWRERLPGGFHEIHYEDLIADPEGQARALIAACGLDWQDACLDFHKTERRVATLSLAQVRQPIYASSLKGWQRHEADLAPLIEALGDAID